MRSHRPDYTVNSQSSESSAPEEKSISPGQLLLRQLLTKSIVLAEDCDKLSPEVQERLTQCHDRPKLLVLLAEFGLITGYQMTRITKGKIFGLVLGNYRILARLGSGGMSEVFKAEHIELRKLVAIKAVEIQDVHDPVHLRRFQAEMRTVGQLQHPNIVAATDAGRCHERSGSDRRTLWYFVMDFVPGENLEYLVRHGEPLDVHKTCDLAHQIASALAEANSRHLVHRDIKPSNILVTPDGKAKLLDFGLARNLTSRDTRRGSLLGTVQYMSPEQAVDASSVDIRSDVFSLGATMYWCLTGSRPFEERRSVAESIVERISKSAPRVRWSRTEIPQELDEIIAQMMAVNVEHRFPTPTLVMAALEPFLREKTRERLAISPRPHSVSELILNVPPDSKDNVGNHRILIVAGGEDTCGICRRVVSKDAIQFDVAVDGMEALGSVKRTAYDLVLVDLDLTGMSGAAVCRRLRENTAVPHQKIIAMTHADAADDTAHLLLKYINDFVVKPISEAQLRARVLAALGTKDQQDNADRLNQHLMESQRQAQQAPAGAPARSDAASDWIM